MVLLKDIVKRLQEKLPKYTDFFSDYIDIISLEKSGNIVTATTNQNNVLQQDNRVLIKGAKTPYIIETLFRYKNIAIAVTQNINNALDESIEISGANEIDYNGIKQKTNYPVYEIESISTIGGVATITTKENHGIEFNSKIEIEIKNVSQSQYNRITKITGIPSLNQITFDLGYNINDAVPVQGKIMSLEIKPNAYTIAFEVENNPITPATGTIYNLMQYNNIYNGFKTIVSKPTYDSFTYTQEGDFESPAQGDIKVCYNIRCTSAVSLTDAIEFYKTKVEENWIIATLNDEIISRDKNVQSDADVIKHNGTTGIETTYTTLNLYIFVPSGNTNNNENILGRYARDFCVSLKPIIHSIIAGYSFPNELQSQESYYPAVMINHGAESYEKGFYIHRYSFQIVGRIFDDDYIDENDISRLIYINNNILNQNKQDIDLEIDIDYSK